MSGRLARAFALGWAVTLLAGTCACQQPAASAVSVVPGVPAVPGQELDRVVAIVNGDPILDSDVDEEVRFEAFERANEPQGVPDATAAGSSRDGAIERLIDRDLILQQIATTSDQKQDPAKVNEQLEALRRTIPACKVDDCQTDAGWARYLATQGLTVDEVKRLWGIRVELLAFTEQRFRMGIRVTSEQIQEFYDKTLVPELKERGKVPPPLEAVSDRIGQVVLEQQVSKLLDGWLQSLRTEGKVVVLHPTPVAGGARDE